MSARVSDHFNGRRFSNPLGAASRSFIDVPRMLAEPRTPWPRRVDVVPQRPPALDGARVVVTFIGHSTFLIQTAAGNILTDPMYSDCAGPFNLVGPRRVRQPGVRFEDLPPIALVLLSHNHYDHCDRPTLAKLARRFDPLVVTPLGNGALFRKEGLRRVEALDWWQSSTISPLRVTATPAQHFSARTPFDRNRALWSGFMLEADGATIYFAGDTGYAPLFREVRQRLGAPDLALLPIGAYEPRWFMRIVHMDPNEAVQAHLDLEATHSIAMHFGTFRLTSEGIDAPVRVLEQACQERQVPADRFRVLPFGGSLRLGTGEP
jgi:L-ascorbate metabolism protein UlaG (beta-lactamase superfamily)